MIKLTIFGFLLVCAVDAWFPEYNWLSIPIFAVVALIWLVVKILRDVLGLKPKRSRRIEDYWDEFDWWQDNQGL